jgi:hypothetical protein
MIIAYTLGVGFGLSKRDLPQAGSMLPRFALGVKCRAMREYLSSEGYLTDAF